MLLCLLIQLTLSITTYKEAPGMVLFLDGGILATFLHCILCCTAAVLKHFGPRTPSHSQKLLRMPKNFCLCRLFLLIFVTQKLKLKFSNILNILNNKCITCQHKIFLNEENVFCRQKISEKSSTVCTFLEIAVMSVWLKRRQTHLLQSVAICCFR